MPEPLYLDLSKPALAEVSAAIEYVRASGGNPEQFADRVSGAFTEAAARLAEEVADSGDGKPWQRTHEGASIRYAQPVYRLDVETAQKRRRGGSSGLWFAYYSLRVSNKVTGSNRAGVGKPDTMYVHAFRHSAGRPIGSDGDTGD